MGYVNYNGDDCFIPAKLINEARRTLVELMNASRLNRNHLINEEKETDKISFTKENARLAVYATTAEQYEAAKECGIEIPEGTLELHCKNCEKKYIHDIY